MREFRHNRVQRTQEGAVDESELVREEPTSDSLVPSETVEHHRDQEGAALVEAAHRQALEQLRSRIPARQEPLTIHYSQLPPPGPDSRLPHEWNTYRREVGRLLAEGNEGRHVLIKHEEIIGVWDTRAEAMAEGYRRFLGEGFLVHQVQERERLLGRISVRPCRNTPIR